MPSVDAAGTELHLRARRGGRADAADPGDERHAPRLGPTLPRCSSRPELRVHRLRQPRDGAARAPAELPFTIADIAADTVGLLDALEIETRPRGRHLDGRDDRPGARPRPPRADPHADDRRQLLRRAPRASLMAAEDLQLLGAGLRLRRARAGLPGDVGDQPLPRLPRGGLALRRASRDGRPRCRRPSRCPAADARLRRPRHHERLGQIAVPTLVIHGDVDRLLGYDNGREVAALDPRRPARDCSRASATCSGGSSRSAPPS